MYIGRTFEFLKRKRFLIQTAFVVVVLAAYVWLIRDQSGWVKGFENSILQWRMDVWPMWDVPKDVVIIGVDENSFGMAEAPLDPETRARAPELDYMRNNWPWSA